MRILLIQPPKAAATIGGEDVYIYEPLALEYLSPVWWQVMMCKFSTCA